MIIAEAAWWVHIDSLYYQLYFCNYLKFSRQKILALQKLITQKSDIPTNRLLSSLTKYTQIASPALGTVTVLE